MKKDSKPINWLLKHALTVGISVLIVTLGTIFVTRSALWTTRIGEDIQVAGTISGDGSGLTNVTGLGTLESLAVSGDIFEGGKPLSEKYSPRFSVGDILLMETSSSAMSELEPSKKVDAYLGAGGEIRTVLLLKSQIEGETVYGRIYKNDVPFGTLRSTTSSAGDTFTEDFEGLVGGDKIQLYLWVTEAAEKCNATLQIKVDECEFIRAGIIR